MSIGKNPINEMTWVKNLELLDQNREKILKNIFQYFLNEEEIIVLGLYLQTGKIENINLLKHIQEKVYNPLLEVPGTVEIYAEVPTEVQALNFKKKIEEAIASNSPDVPGFIGNLDYIDMLKLYQKKGGNIHELKKTNGESVSYEYIKSLDLEKSKIEAQESLEVIENFKNKTYSEFINFQGHKHFGFYMIDEFTKKGGDLTELSMADGSFFSQEKYLVLQRIYYKKQAEECLLEAENLYEEGKYFDVPYSVLEQFEKKVGPLSLLKTKNGDTLTEAYIKELYLKSWAFSIKESVKEMENGTAEHGGLPSYEISDYLKDGGKLKWLGNNKNGQPITKEYVDYLKLD